MNGILTRILSLSIGVFLLTACALGPDYQRPPTETADRFRMAEGPPDLPSLANRPWGSLTGQVIAAETEQEIFAALNLDWIHPEDRER